MLQSKVTNKTREVIEFILSLDERDLNILEKRFKYRLTLEQVGTLLDISRQRVFQVENKIVKKINDLYGTN
jgi:DNA-directed RNA polymerase specialized sigma subunit